MNWLDAKVFRNVIFRSATVVLALASIGGALGQYNAESDVYLRVENQTAEEVAATAGVGEAGGVLFEAQEGAHGLVGESSGQSVSHYYIWICVGDECVPVDPFEYSR